MPPGREECQRASRWRRRRYRTGGREGGTIVSRERNLDQDDMFPLIGMVARTISPDLPRQQCEPYTTTADDQFPAARIQGSRCQSQTRSSIRLTACTHIDSRMMRNLVGRRHQDWTYLAYPGREAETSPQGYHSEEATAIEYTAIEYLDVVRPRQ